MATPLLKEDRAKILGYLKQQDLSDLTGVKIKELVKDNFGINISQPTASKLKGEILEDLDDSSLSEKTDVGATKSDKIRQLSIEQQNAIDHLLQGKSDRVAAEAVGVSRQTVWEWRNHDPLFIAGLNRERSELWMEARGRLKLMANRALDVLEQQLDGDDPKASLTAAKYILQGTKLLGDTDLPAAGPITPEAVIMEDLRREARQELRKQKPMYSEFDPVGAEVENARVETLATSRLNEALKKAGLA